METGIEEQVNTNQETEQVQTVENQMVIEQQAPVDETSVTLETINYGTGITFIFDNELLIGERRPLTPEERRLVLNKDVKVIKVEKTPWKFRNSNHVYFFKVSFEAVNKHLSDVNALNDLNNQSELNKPLLVPYFFIFEFDLAQWGVEDLSKYVL